MATTLNPSFTTFSGARAKFTVANEVLAEATGVSGGEMISYEPVRVLNHLEVVQHDAVAYTVSLNAAALLVVGESLRKRGLMPTGAGNARAFLQSVFSMNEMNCEITDDVTGEVIAQFSGVKLAGYSFSVQPGSLTYLDVPFVARWISNEPEA